MCRLVDHRPPQSRDDQRAEGPAGCHSLPKTPPRLRDARRPLKSRIDHCVDGAPDFPKLNPGRTGGCGTPLCEFQPGSVSRICLKPRTDLACGDPGWVIVVVGIHGKRSTGPCGTTHARRCFSESRSAGRLARPGPPHRTSRYSAASDRAALRKPCVFRQETPSRRKREDRRLAIPALQPGDWLLFHVCDLDEEIRYGRHVVRRAPMQIHVGELLEHGCRPRHPRILHPPSASRQTQDSGMDAMASRPHPGRQKPD